MILLLDTSSNRLRIALSSETGIIASIDEPAFQTQSEILTDRINKLLIENELKPRDIKSIVVANGPGSYTGVRIAVSVAKVWSYAMNIPLYAVSSLGLYAHQEYTTICVLDARNGRSFVGIYRQNSIILQDTILSNDEIMEIAKREKYLINGETKHLGVESFNAPIFNNMLNMMVEENIVQDVKALKPVYLKG